MVVGYHHFRKPPYDNVFPFIGHALWAALLAPNNLPGAAHGSQDLIYESMFGIKRQSI